MRSCVRLCIKVVCPGQSGAFFPINGRKYCCAKHRQRTRERAATTFSEGLGHYIWGPVLDILHKKLERVLFAPLRLKIDNLEREVERLTVEDSKLREDYPGASERLDREAELQKTKNDVAELTNRMEVLEQQLAEYKCGGGRGSHSPADSTWRQRRQRRSRDCDRRSGRTRKSSGKICR